MREFALLLFVLCFGAFCVWAREEPAAPSATVGP
jgi:hypothetical protein